MGELMTTYRGLLPAQMTIPVAAATLLEKKNMVGLDTNGRLVPGGTIASGCLKVIGRNLSKVDNSAGSAGDLDGQVELGVIEWTNSATDPVTAADVGQVVYCEAPGIIAKTSSSGTLPVAGIMTELTADDMVATFMAPWVAEIAQAAILADAGVALQKRSLVLGHAALTDADTSQVVAIGAALPANARILAVDFHTYTAFAGGTVSALTVDVGSTGDADALIDGADIFGAAVDGKPPTLTAGVHPNKTYATATQLNATVVSTGDNLVNLTAGAVTIDVLFAVLA